MTHALEIADAGVAEAISQPVRRCLYAGEANEHLYCFFWLSQGMVGRSVDEGPPLRVGSTGADACRAAIVRNMSRMPVARLAIFAAAIDAVLEARP